MKTSKKIFSKKHKYALVLSILLIISIPKTIYSQTYKIINNSPCTITVDIDLYNSGTCVYCATDSGVNIGSGNSYVIPNLGCGTICNIIVTVTDFGGTPQSTTCTFFNGNVTLTGCTGQTIEYFGANFWFLIN